MAYESKEWVCGDTITADELNRMERGIADSGLFVIKITTNNFYAANVQKGRTVNIELDKTYSEISEAIANGLDLVVDVPYADTPSGAAMRRLPLHTYSGGNVAFACTTISVAVKDYETLNVNAWDGGSTFAINSGTLS